MHSKVIYIYFQLTVYLFYSHLYYCTFSIKLSRFHGVKCVGSVYLHGI